MAFSINDFPGECLNHLCETVIGFDVDDSISVAAGTPATLVVDTSTIQDGSTLSLDNQVHITYAAVADTANNIGTPAFASQNASTILNATLYGSKYFTITGIGDDLTITRLNCCDRINVTLTNLDAAPSLLSLTADPTPPSLLQNYQVRGCIDCNGEETTFCVYPTTTGDDCNIDTASASFDISSFLRGCVSTPEPVYKVSTGGLVLYTELATNVTDVTITAGPYYGSPAGHYGPDDTETFTIINALKLDTPADYCTGAARKLLTSYVSGANICVDQSWRLSMYTAGFPIGAVFTAYNHSGIAYYTGATGQTTSGEMIEEAQSIIADWSGIFDVTLASRIDITLSANSIDSEVFSFYVTCCNSGTEFVFLNQHGTYDSLVTGKVLTGGVTTLHKYVEFCKPCGSKTDRGITAYCGESFQDFTVRFKDQDWYQEEALNQFLASKEVYVVIDRVLYPIQPLTTETQTYSTVKINPEYNFRLQSIESL